MLRAEPLFSPLSTQEIIQTPRAIADESDRRSSGVQPLLSLAIVGHSARSLAHYARSLARSGFQSKIAARLRREIRLALASPPRPQTIASLLLRSFASPLANCARGSGRAGHPLASLACECLRLDPQFDFGFAWFGSRFDKNSIVFPVFISLESNKMEKTWIFRQKFAITESNFLQYEQLLEFSIEITLKYPNSIILYLK
jgi:hypothetical protein